MEDDNFFAEIDSMGIVEQHIKRVLTLEDVEAKRMLARYKEVRQELRDRLDRLPGDIFTAQQMRGTLAQIDGAITAMTLSLKSGMKDASFNAAMMGVEHQISEIRKFDQHFLGAVVPINLNAALVAQDTNNFLINRFDASIEAYSQDLRSTLVSELTNQMLMQAPFSRVVQGLGKFFQGEEWKLHRIARTELHNVYNVGKMNGMAEVKDSTLPDLMKGLVHPMDSRTAADSKALALIDPIVPIDKPFRFRWKGETRVFMAPPDRPNDRAILVPYRQAWKS